MSTNTNEPDIRPEVAEAAAAERTARLEALAAKLADRVKDPHDPEWRPLFYSIHDAEARFGPEVAEAISEGDLTGLPAAIAEAIIEHISLDRDDPPMILSGIQMSNYLPTLHWYQTVLAEIRIQSTLGERVEFRCWYEDGAYQYDFVDEYHRSARKLYHRGLSTPDDDEDEDDEDDFVGDDASGPGMCRLPIVSSAEPLTLRQLIEVMESCADIEEHWGQDMDLDSGYGLMSVDLLYAPGPSDFLNIHSPPYPGFNAWFQEKARDYDLRAKFDGANVTGRVSIPEGLQYAPCFDEVTDLTIEGPIDHELVGLSAECLVDLKSLCLWDGAELPDFNLPPLEDLKWTMPDGRSLWWWDAWHEVEEHEYDQIEKTIEERCGREYSLDGSGLPLGLLKLRVSSGSRVPLLPYPALTDLRLGSGVEIPAAIELPSLETLHLDGTVSLPAWVDIPTLRTLRLSDEAQVTGEISLPGLESLEMGRGATLSERITIPPLKSVKVGVGVKPPAELGLPTAESFSYTAERRPVDGVEQLVVTHVEVGDQGAFPSALDLSHVEALEVGRGVELPDSLVLPSVQSLWLGEDVTLPAGLSLPSLRKLRLGKGCIVSDGVLMPKLEVLHQAGDVRIGDAVETPALKSGLVFESSRTTACRLLDAPGVQVRETTSCGRWEWSRD